MKKFTWDIYTLVIFLYNKHKENKMTTKQMKTFKVIHFSMKVFILQHNCVKRTTTKCPKGDGKSDIGSYFLITEINISLIQFSSVTQSCPTLCDPMDSSTPGLPVHHQLPECTQTHDHRVGDAIQPSHPLLSPSPPAFNLSQHQDLFQCVSSSHQVAKVFELQLQSFQIATFFIKKKKLLRKINNKKIANSFLFFLSLHFLFKHPPVNMY